jgi:DnaK suppressor protein
MDPERARELVAAERRRIERKLAELRESQGSSELANQDQHLADEGSDVYDREFEQGLADQLERELAAVERAEARLAEGTYGLSVESGEPIPDERLEANPLAERTVEEERRYEAGR